MGGSSSRAARKFANLFGSAGDSGEDDGQTSGSNRSPGPRQSSCLLANFKGGSPFVLTRKGSMYIDEDGDVAHEFYEEVPASACDKGSAHLNKITSNIKPQGQIPHEFPRLNADLPVILSEQ